MKPSSPNTYFLPLLTVFVLWVGGTASQVVIRAYFESAAPSDFNLVSESVSFNCTQKHHKRGFIDFCRIGERVKPDHLVDRRQENHSFPKPTNFSLNVEYPRSGQNGFTITYVEMQVYQDSMHPAQYLVVSGGIGQRQITLSLSSNLITHLNYNASFFGI